MTNEEAIIMTMPQKDLFTPARLFIKPVGQPEADWQELVRPIVRDSITISEEVPDSLQPTTLNFTATINISRKNRERILKIIGFMKRPRLTYRTIRRNCAKRNI